MIVGAISDTHGTLDPCAAYALAGVDHIIHAGDIGTDQVLVDLAAIAPVTAVRGNCDREGVGRGLERRAIVVLGGTRFIVAHKAKHATADLDATVLDGAVVVVGHTHSPTVGWRDATLWVNPGSATNPLYGSVASVALIEIAEHGVEARIVAI